MIIIYEIAVIGLLITFVIFCARPLFEAAAHRIRSQADKNGETPLETKIEYLEAEVMELKQQMRILQESNEFLLASRPDAV